MFLIHYGIIIPLIFYVNRECTLSTDNDFPIELAYSVLLHLLTGPPSSDWIPEGLASIAKLLSPPMISFLIFFKYNSFVPIITLTRLLTLDSSCSFCVTDMKENTSKLLILYASQTGNALDAAERIGREAEHRGCTVKVFSIDEFDAVSLQNFSFWLLKICNRAKFCFNHWIIEALIFKLMICLSIWILFLWFQMIK